MNKSVELFVINTNNISFNVSKIIDYYPTDVLVTEIQFQRVGYDSYFIIDEIEKAELCRSLTSDHMMQIEMDNYILFYKKALYKYNKLQIFI